MDQLTFTQMLLARWQSTTPTFFQKVKRVSLYFSGLFGLIAFLFSEVFSALPHSSTYSLAAGFLMTFFGAMATTSQLSTTTPALMDTPKKNIIEVDNSQ